MGPYTPDRGVDPTEKGSAMEKDAEATVCRGNTMMHDGLWISYANRAHSGVG